MDTKNIIIDILKYPPDFLSMSFAQDASRLYLLI